MKKYIGTKLISAEPMTRGEFNRLKGWKDLPDDDPAAPGYRVKYADNYVSWSPKETFERAYLAVDDNKDLPSGVSVGQKMVDEFISYIEICTMGEKTTVVRCVLRNGFEIYETSTCVDARNYNQEIGQQICMERIENKIWELLGFLLQTAWHGIR